MIRRHEIDGFSVINDPTQLESNSVINEDEAGKKITPVVAKGK